ncbi:hypothetical protein AV530_006025 [Patagioenas fasciata monilis]|uniref:Uncharacterized protein n=1 Tax=Patagioenas fasciata monilis TaxID=372326 RepID=A0A1V4J8M2_PATFA|nr:hypothetical protein AV530_006025 [Patagioenas fasciata monilis]
MNQGFRSLVESILRSQEDSHLTLPARQEKINKKEKSDVNTVLTFDTLRSNKWTQCLTSHSYLACRTALFFKVWREKPL